VSGPAAAARDNTAALQALIDATATFNIFVTADRGGGDSRARPRGDGGGVAGIRCGGLLRRFDIELETPSASGVRAANLLGEAVGRIDISWTFIPNSFAARPGGRGAPSERLDPTRSQRFVMDEMTFTFGDGRDGFRSFGTGRTFPVDAGGRARLVVAAIGILTEGFGRFRGHEGNYTLCGELTEGGGFAGHVIGRVVDEQGDLRTSASLPRASSGGERPDEDYTYLMWLAQKGKGPSQANRPSLTPDRQLRGLNIPMELKLVRSSFGANGGEGFRAGLLRVGEVIGLEVGFGRGSRPDAIADGTADNPAQFEGVARYRFDDPQGGNAAGSFTTNVLEGRRIDYRYSAAPGETAWRFGFFGPILYGAGCFQGVEGTFYGASNSFFKPPPGDHVITHCYFARVYDPDGKFRSRAGSGGSR
jgi:hypothetical protein